MKTILVPTDFSKSAENAMYYACELASATGAKIILFHAYHIPVAVAEMPTIVVSMEELDKELTAKMEKVKEEILSVYKLLIVKCELKAGFAAEEIADMAKEKNADLIVMGITGAGKLGQVLIGSNTISLIRRTAVPVLVVPEEARFRVPASIALASDYKEIQNNESIEFLKKLLHDFNAHLLVFNVHKEKEPVTVEKAAAGLRLENQLSDVEHDLYFPEDESVIHGIDEFVTNHQVDMLVMVSRKHHIFDRLLHASNTKRMLFHTHIPLLVLHE
ncbi:MAG: universal stress protein [Bacteroidota bacterium]